MEKATFACVGSLAQEHFVAVLSPVFRAVAAEEMRKKSLGLVLDKQLEGHVVGYQETQLASMAWEHPEKPGQDPETVGVGAQEEHCIDFVFGQQQHFALEDCLE